MARAGLRRARTASRARARGSPASIEATPYSAGQGAAARAHARRPEGGPAPAAARDAHAARADLPALRRRPAARAARRASPTWTSRRAASARGCGGCRPSELELDVPLLIADGHHRYETAVAFREEDPSATHTFAVLVSSRSPGLEIFPTHRLVPALAAEPSACNDVVPGIEARWRSTATGELLPGRLATTSSTRARSSGTSRERRRLHAVRRGGGRGRRPRRGRGRVPRPRAHGRAGGGVRRARRDDAAEVDVLLPEADLRPAPLPAVTAPGSSSAAPPSRT